MWVVGGGEKQAGPGVAGRAVGWTDRWVGGWVRARKQARDKPANPDD